MFLIAGTAFLLILTLTLIMLWGHEKLTLRRFIPHAKVEEYWPEGDERREHLRFDKNLEVEYSVEKKPRLTNGKTVNISKGGMKLMLDEKLPNGTIIDLKIYTAGDKQVIAVEGEIVWTKEVEERSPSGKRFFHSGIKFVRIQEPSGIHLDGFINSLHG